MIISEKNQKSNRQNAQHSTGPKTTEGKAAIRFNALTYGLRTRATTTPGSGTNWKPTGNPKTAPNAATWKPWSPPNGCSRRLPIARGRSTSSSNSAKNRSEEHTSELQSLRHLVCRLLLEKKNVRDGPHAARYGQQHRRRGQSLQGLAQRAALFFFFKDARTPEISSLPLPNAFPI